jgi:hypothetical protein
MAVSKDNPPTGRTSLSPTKASEVSPGFSRLESSYFKRVTGNLGLVSLFAHGLEPVA